MGERKGKGLVLTQDPAVAEIARGGLEQCDQQAADVRKVDTLASLVERGANLVIVDLGMPDRDLKAAAATLGSHRNLPDLVLASRSLALWHRISRGNPLESVLETPFDDSDVAGAVDELLSKGRWLHENLVGQSEMIQELRDQILLVGPAPVTALITGESGTGKDVVAQALHLYSQHRDLPFKAVNCAAIPENLLENELFGHEKGAYTDARAQYRGVFEQASGGTVFLDEIGEMALAAQVRLLRVVEEREITRVGGSKSIPVDVRLVAATNRDLRQAVSEGQFRRDLYHRLKVVELNLAPLRHRRKDIPALVDHFVALYQSKSRGMRFHSFSKDALELLCEYDWPGNVRELRNIVEHFVLVGPERAVCPDDLIPQLEIAPAGERHLPIATGKTPDQSERELIYFALLDLKREVSELKELVSGRTPEAAPGRPVFQSLDDPRGEIAPAEIVGQEQRAAGERAEGTLKDLEREAIERALRQVGGNRRRAAKLLGIGVRTLYRKLDEYGLK